MKHWVELMNPTASSFDKPVAVLSNLPKVHKSATGQRGGIPIFVEEVFTWAWQKGRRVQLLQVCSFVSIRDSQDQKEGTIFVRTILFNKNKVTKLVSALLECSSLLTYICISHSLLTWAWWEFWLINQYLIYAGLFLQFSELHGCWQELIEEDSFYLKLKWPNHLPEIWLIILIALFPQAYWITQWWTWLWQPIGSPKPSNVH